jgi:hypothetical protein
VDIASDGGDEFVIAKAGWLCGQHCSSLSSGKQNANAVDVAGVVMREIEKPVSRFIKIARSFETEFESRSIPSD